MSESKDDLAALFSGSALTRRRLMQCLAGVFAPAAVTAKSWSTGALKQSPATSATELPYDPAVLPSGIRSTFVNDINGLRMHVLEAGFETTGRQCVLLLHGFPELAYSWRKVMLPLAAAGFYVIAPDRRGYGRTSGWDVNYDDDISPFNTLNQIKDMEELVLSFGYSSVAAVIGHDQGAPIASWASLVRPDIFRSVVMMSSPFAGAPRTPFFVTDRAQPNAAVSAPVDLIDKDLAAMNPPRKYYQKYYTTRPANEDIWHPPQGIHAFLRAYYHMKSADWKQNAPFPLKERTANEWAKLPRYYVMDLDKNMAETVASEMPSAAAIAACKWLPENELKVYSSEFGRTGFQGGLNGYRVRWSIKDPAELRLFYGRSIDVPSLFISGKSDWAVFQTPGDFEKMQKSGCTRLLGTHLLEGAGHWVQQEQAEEVSKLLVQFLLDKSQHKNRP